MSTYKTWVSLDPGCIRMASSSPELFSLNIQQYVSDKLQNRGENIRLMVDVKGKEQSI